MGKSEKQEYHKNNQRHLINILIFIGQQQKYKRLCRCKVRCLQKVTDYAMFGDMIFIYAYNRKVATLSINSEYYPMLKNTVDTC